MNDAPYMTNADFNPAGFGPDLVGNIVTIQVFLKDDHGEILPDTLEKTTGMLMAYSMNQHGISVFFAGLSHINVNYKTHTIEVFDKKQKPVTIETNPGGSIYVRNE